MARRTPSRTAPTNARRGWGGEIPAAHLSRALVALENHRGAARPIKSRDIAAIIGVRDETGRHVREVLNALIVQGHPVGSINFESGGGGYYLVETEAELARCVAQYRSRARAILSKAEALERAFCYGVQQPTLTGTDAAVPAGQGHSR